MLRSASASRLARQRRKLLALYAFLLSALIVPDMPLSAPVPPSVLAQARQAVDLIYNMEFEPALKMAREITDMAPDHPAGYFYRAAVHWQLRLIVREASRRTELLGRFRAAISRTIDVAQQLPASQAADAAFYLGAAYGMRARMYAVERHFFKALQAAKKGGTYLKQCLDIDPTYDDAYLGLGLYHYAIARVPYLVRGIVQAVVGMKGDRSRGLRELEHARTRSSLAAPEAASLLAKIYTSSSERQYDKAHGLLQQLVRRYPNNFDYRFRLLVVSEHLGLWDQARRISQDLRVDIEDGKPHYSRRWLPLLRYRTAETHVLQGNDTAAQPLLQRLLSEDLERPLRAWVTLRLGNIYDLQGNRQIARAVYEQVEGDDKAQQLAAQYLTTPFSTVQIEVKPLDKII